MFVLSQFRETRTNRFTKFIYSTQLVHCLLFWHPQRFVLITKQCHILDLCVLFKRACANLWKPFDFRLKHKTKTQQVYLFRWFFDQWCKKNDWRKRNKQTHTSWIRVVVLSKKVRFIIVLFSTIKTVFFWSDLFGKKVVIFLFYQPIGGLCIFCNNFWTKKLLLRIFVRIQLIWSRKKTFSLWTVTIRWIRR